MFPRKWGASWRPFVFWFERQDDAGRALLIGGRWRRNTGKLRPSFAGHQHRDVPGDCSSHDAAYLRRRDIGMESVTDQRRTVTVTEAARQLGISRSFAYQAIARRDFPVAVLRIGGRRGEPHGARPLPRRRNRSEQWR
jgi:hypothetical protein